MMQVVILCGGTGTRLKEQTEFVPKPMIPIGGKPILWHIMKMYAHHGYSRFVLALGYKQELVKSYFLHYDMMNADLTIRTGTYRGMPIVSHPGEDWEISMIDTGENTLKGGRLKRIEKYIQGETFMVTYGDGVGNIDIPGLLAFHKAHGKLVTLTGVHPVPRFGELICDKKGRVLQYKEKQHADGCLTNGGFMVMNKGIFEYLTPVSDLEYGPFELLAAKGELMVREHAGFWGCMDNLNDMLALQARWDRGNAPWEVWR